MLQQVPQKTVLFSSTRTPRSPKSLVSPAQQVSGRHQTHHIHRLLGCWQHVLAFDEHPIYVKDKSWESEGAAAGVCVDCSWSTHAAGPCSIGLHG